MGKKTSKKNAGPDIAVNINIGCDIVRFNHRRMVKMAQGIAEKFRVKKAQINFFVTGDEEIIRINRKFLRKKNPTDCLSFDLSDKRDDIKVFDIVVNAQMAQRQAKSRGHKPQSELALYFLHGLLHNLGFDDSTAGKAAKMHKTEDSILKKFGYGVVYSQKK
ncbi:MAG: rRNA maturation RNase YbeY [Sedimentisphaerales bacterium]